MISDSLRRLLEEPTYYSLTENPDLYKKTYWGHHRGKPKQTIINNRNKFIEDYGITKAIRILDERTTKRLFDTLYYSEGDIYKDELFNYNENSNYFSKREFKDYYLYNTLPTIYRYPKDHLSVYNLYKDHREYYLSNKYEGCIINIFSSFVSEKENKLLIEDGYKEIYPLYNENQKTYIKIAPKLIKNYRILKNKYNI